MSAHPAERIARLERALRRRTAAAAIVCGAVILYAVWPRTSISLEDGGRTTQISPGRIELHGGGEARVTLASTSNSTTMVVQGKHGSFTIADDDTGFRLEVDLQNSAHAHVRVAPDGAIAVEARHAHLGLFQYSGSERNARWYAAASEALVRATAPLTEGEDATEPR